MTTAGDLEALLRASGAQILDNGGHEVDPGVPALAWRSHQGLDGAPDGPFAPWYAMRPSPARDAFMAMLAETAGGGDRVELAGASFRFETARDGMRLTQGRAERPIAGRMARAALERASDGAPAQALVRGGPEGMAEMAGLLDDVYALGRIDALVEGWRTQDGRVRPPGAASGPIIVFATPGEQARSTVPLGYAYWHASQRPDAARARRELAMRERWDVQAIDRLAAWYQPRAEDADRKRIVGIRAKRMEGCSATLAAAGRTRARQAGARVAAFLEKTGAHPSLVHDCLAAAGKAMIR